MSDPVQRLNILVQRYFDAELTDREGRELLALWEMHPECRRDLEDQYKTEHLLRFRPPSVAALVALYRESVRLPNESGLLDWLDKIVQLEKAAPALDIPKPVPAPTARKPLKPPTPRTERKSNTSFLVCATALVVLFGVAIFYEFNPSSKQDAAPFLAHGVVDAVLDVRWPTDTEPLKPGQSVTTERIRFESGLLQFRLENGVRLALEGPTDFKVNSEKHVFCGLGRVSATVAESGKGFEVQTPFGAVVDLGTEFSLQVAEDNVQTHTHRGKVLMNRLPRNETVQLPAGKAFAIDSAGTQRHFDADPALFRPENEVRDRVRVRDQRALARWETELASWARDPGLMLLLDFQTKDGLPGLRRTTGRWEGKKAVAIASKRDAVAVNLPKELRSLTLSASVRIDSLKRFNHFLLASETQDPGHVVWQIWGDGSLHFSVGPPTGRTPVHFATPRHFSRKHWGAWYDVAVVVDADRKSVTHYIDGEPIADDTIPNENLPIRIGPATIGNGLLQGKRLSDCSFDGCFEEFLVFDRPLTPEEIRRLHD